MAKITDLSVEVLFKLFKYFDINTLLKCRQLNKKLKRLIEQFRIKKLCVSNEDQLTSSYYVSYPSFLF